MNQPFLVPLDMVEGYLSHVSLVNAAEPRFLPTLM
jgi:hypothetical protein